MDDLSADDPVAFGRAVAARRAELGLSRKDVSARCGLSYPYLANIESGHKQPSAKALHGLAQALELRPADLLARADHLRASDRLPFGGEIARSPEGWFRGSSRTPAATSRTDADDMRAMIRDIVRDEMRLARTDAPADDSPPPATEVPRLPDAIWSRLPTWLTRPAPSATDMALQAVVLERLHRLSPTTDPAEIDTEINAALDQLIQRAQKRHRPRQAHRNR